MKKIVKIPLIILGIAVVLFIGLMVLAGSSPDPFAAPDLADEELDLFLNSYFGYWNGWGGDELNFSETINEVFYSENQAEGYSISAPKFLGKKGGTSSIVIIIKEYDKPDAPANTMVYINHTKEGARYYSVLDHIDQVDNGRKTRLGDNLGEMNAVFISIYPDGFFSEYAEKWKELVHADTERMFAEREKAAKERSEQERKEAEERMAKLTPEGWPKDSIYTSVLVLREGVLDFHDSTVGNAFFTGNRVEGIAVSEPRRSGRFQIISVTSSVNRSAKFDIYLIYDNKSQMSLLEKIEIKDGNKTTIAATFEEKYATLLVLLPLLINESNLGE